MTLIGTIGPNDHRVGRLYM